MERLGARRQAVAQSGEPPASLLVRAAASLDVVGQQLVDLANDHGGRDNVSVMLAQVKEAFPAKKSLFAKIAGLFRS